MRRGIDLARVMIVHLRVIGRYLRGVGVGSVVVESADDDAAHTVEYGCRITAARILEIFHFAGVTTGEPLVEAVQFG